ncbi:MAG: type III ribulose-bisphosphate carboxylase [Candidatus ainarchaeum sp.]|nr:type III ribulose-bisphosphate carboxylase [Candidatus ainarchaeum sp.]
MNNLKNVKKNNVLKSRTFSNSLKLTSKKNFLTLDSNLKSKKSVVKNLYRAAYHSSNRVKEYEGYIDRNYTPNKNDLVCEYYLEPANGISFESACQRVASESSIGTWTDIGTMSHDLFNKLAPKIFSLNPKNGIFKVAYSCELFEEHNVAQIMSAIAGNIFGMSDVKNLKLLDIDFPNSFIRHYSGPMYGINGIRKIMKEKYRPFVGTSVKPKVGLTEAGHSLIAYDSWIGGCDFVNDDENLTSLKSNNFDKRISLTLRARDKAEQVTGEKKIYAPNITAPYPEMVRRAKEVMRNGGEYVLIDILTTGWSAVQAFKDLDLRVVIHGHRAMHAAFTRNPNHGISMLAIAKFCRLIGVDQLHVGGIVGRMFEGEKDVVNVGESIESQIVSKNIFRHRLQEDWLNLNPMLAVCSGGLCPAKVQPLIHAMGRDTLIMAGGGIHGHPNGTIAGAKAMRQAVDAETYGIDPHEYALTHLELKLALEKWKK